jgi:predicted transcriptional regulator
MSKEQFDRLINKLDMLIKITVASAFQGKSKAQIAVILSELGFQNVEIAQLLVTTPAYINKVKYLAKKAKEKEERERRKKEGKKAKAKQPKQEKVESHDEQGTV